MTTSNRSAAPRSKRRTRSTVVHGLSSFADTYRYCQQKEFADSNLAINAGGQVRPPVVFPRLRPNRA
jgi:hypothetical protein